MISMIISWHNRSEFKKALPSMLENIQMVNGDLTVVNFMGDSELLQDQIKEFADQLKVITVPGNNRYNIEEDSIAKNFFSEEEYFYYKEYRQCHSQAFYQFWTAKEAIIKAYGKG